MSHPMHHIELYCIVFVSCRVVLVSRWNALQCVWMRSNASDCYRSNDYLLLWLLLRCNALIVKSRKCEFRWKSYCNGFIWRFWRYDIESEGLRFVLQSQIFATSTTTIVMAWNCLRVRHLTNNASPCHTTSSHATLSWRSKCQSSRSTFKVCTC